jgi:heterodisulfide reductase subunit A-like polyferredoxin
MKFTVAAIAIMASTVTAFTPSTFVKTTPVGHRAAAYSSSSLCMKYKVAVVGGGPSGACAAEIFAQEKGIDTVMFERKMDNAKPCGGAIPLCMVGEFDLPETVVDRKVCSLVSALSSVDRVHSMSYALCAVISELFGNVATSTVLVSRSSSYLVAACCSCCKERCLYTRRLMIAKS